MPSIPEKYKSLSKLAQIYNAINSNFTLQKIAKIISKQDSIDQKISPHSFIKSINPELAGGTALHIALSHRNIQVLELLLNFDADYTIKNSNGSTPLHYIATSDLYAFSDEKKLEIKSFVDILLSAHVKSRNFINPRDKDGLTHLHIACMVNHTDAIKLFLENGEDVNQIINIDASSNPGFTSLHFAVKSYNIETVKTLLDYGASIFSKDIKEMTALHLLLSQKMDVYSSMDIGIHDEFSTSNFKDIEDFIDLLLEKIPRDKLIIDETGLSRFHIACTSQDTSFVECILETVVDINHSISTSSQTWPGYTGLHFAAHCNINTVKMLLIRGADLEIKDARGVSPFEICLRRCKISDICSIVSHKQEWKDTLLSNGNVRLSDLLSAMVSASRLKGLLQSGQVFINACLPKTSKLWPGYTPLHLAVTLTARYTGPSKLNLDLVRECLSDGADVTIKDSHGRTPLNLAFREYKTRVVDLLLHCHHVLANPSDEDNLSHLHIACDAQNEILVENLLLRTGDVNVAYKGSVTIKSIKPGYTPLHIAVAKRHLKLVDILMRHGADVNLADLAGYTPIHEMFHLGDRELLAKRLFSSSTLRESVVGGHGLSNLHVASANNDVDTVERLLQLGANVNAAYQGITSLHVAVKAEAFEVVIRLLERGADILSRSDRDSTPLSTALRSGYEKGLRSFVLILKSDGNLQARLESETGMTMLHLACHLVDVDEIKSLLIKGANVNARVNENLEIWAGCTPLHVLSLKENKCAHNMSSREELHEKILVISEILLNAGADVGLVDVQGETPIHTAFKLNVVDTRYTRVRQFMSYHRDFSANPINAKGFSHFHLACMVNVVAAIEKFIQYGTDINKPIDFFSDEYPGCYPIHLAIDARSNRLFGSRAQLETVELLINHGVDVRAENSHGYTALHEAARVAPGVRKRIMELVFSAGPDVNSVSIHGETPLEILLSTAAIATQEIQIFIEHNARINSHNLNSQRGYLSMLLSKTYGQTAAFEEMMKAPDISQIDERGRSAMHNVVTTANPNISSEEYVRYFERFTNLGCNVDDQDMFGYTALHLASQFGNKEATLALLTSGADVNIVDLTNKSPFSYAIEICRKCDQTPTHRHTDVIQTLALHLHKLQLLGLDVSPLNSSLKETRACPRVDVEAEFDEQVDIAKGLEIAQTSLVAADFLREMKVVVEYPYMNVRERSAIDEFFNDIDSRGIELLRGILTLQYRKAVKRLRLVEFAMPALRSLLGFPLPELCCEMVLGFLRNADLKNMIEATGDDV